MYNAPKIRILGEIEKSNCHFVNITYEEGVCLDVRSGESSKSSAIWRLGLSERKGKNDGAIKRLSVKECL